MVLPVALLVSACLLVGIFPSVTAGPFLATAAHAVLGSDIPAYSLNVWHGITITLLMSANALIGGVLLYLVLRTYFSRGTEGPPVLRHLEPQSNFDRAFVSMSWLPAYSGGERLSARPLQPPYPF